MPDAGTDAVEAVATELFGDVARKAIELLALVASERGRMGSEDGRLNLYCDDRPGGEDTINLCFDAGYLEQVQLDEDEFQIVLLLKGRAALSAKETEPPAQEGVEYIGHPQLGTPDPAFKPVGEEGLVERKALEDKLRYLCHHDEIMPLVDALIQSQAADLARLKEQVALARERFERIRDYRWPDIVGHHVEKFCVAATGNEYSLKHPIPREQPHQALRSVQEIARTTLQEMNL